MKIKVVTDYNDGDYITHVYNIDEKTFNKFLPLIKAIQNFEPYPYKFGIEYCNFMIGDLCNLRDGNKSPYVAYPDFSKYHINDFICTLLEYNQSEYGIHTIVEISNVVTDEIYLKSEYPEKYEKTNDNVKEFLNAQQKILKQWADLCGCPVKKVTSIKFSDMSEAALKKCNEYNNLWKQFRTDLV